MTIPLVGVDGVRQTVNAHLTPAQATWNMRSALNVAALNCLEPRHVMILENYKSFLKTHAKTLSAANKASLNEFRAKHGASSYRNMQDAYMTQVYNYFALPPALDQFCDAALMVSNELAAVPAGQLESFSTRALPQLEAVFEGFFRSYEQYRRDVAAWDAQYNPNRGLYGATSSQNLTAGYATPGATSGSDVPTTIKETVVPPSTAAANTGNTPKEGPTP